MQTSQPISEKSSDILIVGAGMVGAALALDLAQRGWRVSLFERKAPAWSAESPPGIRVSALTPYSLQYLQALGVLAEMQDTGRVHPIAAMDVWSEDYPQPLTFGHPQGLGAVIENDLTQFALWQALRKHHLVELVVDDAPLHTYQAVDAATVEQNHQRWRAPLLVGADGAQSQVREQAQVATLYRDYAAFAVVGNVRTERPNRQKCYQGYHPQGPFAFLTLGDHINSIAWYLPIDQWQWFQSLDDEAFRQAITKASDGVLGEILEVGERGAFPLIGGQAETYVKPRLVLVGDAAHRIHPQAGQGVNLGFMDAASLAQVVHAARQNQQDYGLLSCLKTYERWRYVDNDLTIRAMEVFSWFFDFDSFWATQWRGQLLPLAQKLPWAKEWLTQAARRGRVHLPQKMAS